MTREEAIKMLKEKRQTFIEEWADLDDIVEAFNMAIEVLSADSDCNNCKEYGSYKCTRCDGEIYYKADGDLISRADAVEAVENNSYGAGSRASVKAIKALPSAEAEPTMTEEVREALMRLTMCAREECGMCKYKDECGFDFQYKISTDNMHTILNAFNSADRQSQRGGNE